MTKTTLNVRNPRTGELDHTITPASRPEVAASCGQLRNAQAKWQAGGLEKRIAVLQTFAEEVARARDALIDALTLDTGRHGISIMEVDSLSPSIERWANIARDLEGPEEGRSTALPFITYSIEKRPYELVGIISPWNFPMILSLIDALPALLAGSAVIIKPSEVAPRFAAPLRRIIAHVPELDTVLNIIDGAGETGSAVVDHVDVICFTGSVATGRKVGETAARNFIPAFLELGGKDPAIVLESADIERAATAILRGSIINSGQGCQSVERIYVARSLYEKFVKSLVEKAEKVTLNTPDINKGHLGPLIFEKQADIIDAQIKDAIDKGATVHSGGEVENHGGLWCRPTVLTDLTPDMKIMQEETFGPLLPILPFDSVEEAVRQANDSDFGLSASVFAATKEEAVAVGRQIDAGGVSINDAALTSLMYEAEKNSFKLSGMGASRMGPSGYLRFFRKQSFMTNTADVFTIDQFDEEKTS